MGPPTSLDEQGRPCAQRPCPDVGARSRSFRSRL